MDRRERAAALAAAGALLVVATLLVGALTAPTLGERADGDRRTLVGSQSTEGGWHAGGAVFLLQDDGVAWREGSAESYFDVTMLGNGTVLAGFMHGGYTEGCGAHETPCVKTGFRRIDPAATGGPAVVGEYAFPVASRTNSETHDVERLPTGEYLVSDMDAERIFTVRGGEVTWSWNASAHYTPPADPTRRDWLHVNDVDAINESHYLVSVRNANQLVLIERGAGVVETINADTDDSNDDVCRQSGRQLVNDADGDVRCGDPAVMNHQHNPQWLGNGAVLVADSDNDRVVELHRTDDGWEPVWSVSSADGLDLHWPRDADRLDNGNTLITDTHNSRIVEVAENGTTVWSEQVFNLPYEAERLPEGERTSAARYTGGAGDGDGETGTGPSAPDDGGVPVLTTVLFGLKGEFAMIPFWFGELHFGVSVVGVALVLGGGVEAVRSRLG